MQQYLFTYLFIYFLYLMWPAKMFVFFQFIPTWQISHHAKTVSRQERSFLTLTCFFIITIIILRSCVAALTGQLLPSVIWAFSFHRATSLILNLLVKRKTLPLYGQLFKGL